MADQAPALWFDWGAMFIAAFRQLPPQWWLLMGALAVIGMLAPARRGRRWRGRGRRRW
jgi:hypothetical protein